MVSRPAACGLRPAACGLRADHDRTNTAFRALLLGVCVVWMLLLGVSGIASVFGLPALPGTWALVVALPGAWSAWQLVATRRRAGMAA
ncbi:MAG: hypothetical protein EOP82_09260 [Variovorax sp.]|nr:MAG: hypothetical protein EOP82_09260 [Variovorax sp.]